MDGFVSLPDSMDKVPVKILRDTGASESFVLESVLPFSAALSAGKNVLIQGKDLQTWQIVWAFSRSASYSEPVEMWICPSHSKVFGGGHGTSSPSEGVGYWKILRVNAFFRSSWLLQKFLSKFFYSCFAVDWFVKRVYKVWVGSLLSKGFWQCENVVSDSYGPYVAQVLLTF